MADDEAEVSGEELIEDESSDDDASAAPESGPNRVEQARNLAQNAARLTNAIKGTAGNVAKLAATVFGPGNKFRLVILVIITGLIGLGISAAVVGMAARLLTELGGSQPAAETFSPSNEEDRTQLALLECFKDRPPGQWMDPGKTTLSGECQKLVVKYVADSQKLVESIKPQLDTALKSAGERAQAATLMQKLAAELDAITNANGKYQETKSHYNEYQKLLKDPLLDRLDLIASSVQVLIDYVKNNPKTACQFSNSEGGADGCARTTIDVLDKAYGLPDRGGAQGARLAGEVPSTFTTTPPSQAQLDQARAILRAGDIPVWHINGEGSGQHWIALVRVELDGTIQFYDPATGEIRSNYTANTASQITRGGVTYDVAYFGMTPLDANGGRGYHFVVPTKFK